MDFKSEIIRLRYREEEQDYRDVDRQNISDPTKVNAAIDTIIREILQDTSSWDEVWEQKTMYFPRLQFCDCVEEQLNSLDFTPTNMKMVKNHLKVMDEYCERIEIEKITPDYTKMGVEASKETLLTLNHYGYQRTFLCPDGEERIFNWHTKQRGPNLRIHFFPLHPDKNGILIGYIGRHLNTYKYHH